jgi:hypothetical protein
MSDDFDDIGLLTTAAHIWRTPHKQRILEDLSAISPSKRQGALQTKIWNLCHPTPPSEPHEEEEQGGQDEGELAEKEQEEEEREEEQEEEEREEEQEEEQEEGSRQRPPTSSPPTSAGSRVRESSPLIRSDTPRGTFEGSEWGTEDDVIKEAGALTKQRPIGSRVAVLSGRPRWTMNKIPEAEKATWTIMFTALTLDYINEGPPPPDAERDSRLTNDSRMRYLIETRYRQAYPDDFSLLGSIEIEAVVFPDQIEVL